jgi:hypothetical protein
LPALVLALEPAGEVERHEGDARPDALGHQRLDACARVASPDRHPDPLPSRDAAFGGVAGLISTNMSCCSSASHLFDRVSSPPPSYSTSRPEVRMIGKLRGRCRCRSPPAASSPDIGHAELAPSSSVGVVRDEFGARRVDRLAMHRHRIGQVPGDERALPLP